MEGDRTYALNRLEQGVKISNPLTSHWSKVQVFWSLEGHPSPEGGGQGCRVRGVSTQGKEA